MMKTLEIQLPEGLDLAVFELKMSMAAKLYDLGKITSGEGAQIVGLSKRAFMELLGEYGVSLFGYTGEEMEKEL